MVPQLLMSSGVTIRVRGSVYGMSAKLQVSAVDNHQCKCGSRNYRNIQNGRTHCIVFRQLHDRLLKHVVNSGPSFFRVGTQLLLIKETCLKILRAGKLLEEIQAITFLRCAIRWDVTTCGFRSCSMGIQQGEEHN